MGKGGIQYFFVPNYSFKGKRKIFYIKGKVISQHYLIGTLDKGIIRPDNTLNSTRRTLTVRVIKLFQCRNIFQTYSIYSRYASFDLKSL